MYARGKPSRWPNRSASWAITGRALAPTSQPPREGDIRHSLGSPTAAQQHTGFSSADSIETGLRSFLA